MSDHIENRVRVWILQQQLQHYRMPVWDELVSRHGQRFDVTVLGRLQNGLPIGAKESRPYVQELSASPLGKGTPWDSVLKRLQEERPQVLVVQLNARLKLCWQLPRFCRRHGIALVGWSKVIGIQEGAKRHISPILKRLLFRQYPALLVYGASSRKELLSFGYGVKDEDIFVSNNTIDTRRIFVDGDQIANRANELRRENGLVGKRILTMVANFSPLKRHVDVLAAWPELRKMDNDLRLVLVGGGELLEEIRRRANELDAERILLTGRVPEGDDYAWMAAADFNIQPGAVGLALNQSMALGTPTLVADEPGPDSEIVKHGVTGWRFRREDPNDIVRVMREIQANPDQSHLVAQRGRELIRDEVNIEHMVESMSRAIERALEKVTFVEKK